MFTIAQTNTSDTLNTKGTHLPNMLGGSVTSLFRSSHLPPAEKCECSVRRSWLAVTDNFVRQVSYIQYLLACKKSPRSTPHNIVKSALLWSRIFRRRHLGRRVTAFTCLRWPTDAHDGASGVVSSTGGRLREVNPLRPSDAYMRQ